MISCKFLTRGFSMFLCQDLAAEVADKWGYHQSGLFIIHKFCWQTNFTICNLTTELSMTSEVIKDLFHNIVGGYHATIWVFDALKMLGSGHKQSCRGSRTRIKSWCIVIHSWIWMAKIISNQPKQNELSNKNLQFSN